MRSTPARPRCPAELAIFGGSSSPTGTRQCFPWVFSVVGLVLFVEGRTRTKLLSWRSCRHTALNRQIHYGLFPSAKIPVGCVGAYMPFYFGRYNQPYMAESTTRISGFSTGVGRHIYLHHYISCTKKGFTDPSDTSVMIISPALTFERLPISVDRRAV